MPLWYYAKLDQQYGPVDDAGLRQLVLDRQLTPTDLVWTDSMSEWRPAAQVKGLFAAVPPVPAAAPHPPAVSGVPAPLAYASAHPAASAGRESYRTLATSALVLGIISFAGGVLPAAVAALVCGFMAQNGMKRSGNYDGKGMATAGIVLGLIWFALALGLLVLIIGLAVLA